MCLCNVAFKMDNSKNRWIAMYRPAEGRTVLIERVLRYSLAV